MMVPGTYTHPTTSALTLDDDREAEHKAHEPGSLAHEEHPKRHTEHCIHDKGEDKERDRRDREAYHALEHVCILLTENDRCDCQGKR